MASLKFIKSLDKISKTILPYKNGIFKKLSPKLPNFFQKKTTLYGVILGTGASVLGFSVVVYSSNGDEKKKKIVILGSGWGAVSMLKSLDTKSYDVTLVSPDNYFLLTPLLPGATVGTVEGRSIIEPVRKMLTKWRKANVKFLEAMCTSIDIENNKVICEDTTEITGLKNQFSLDYDYLVVAVGAQTATFNIKGVKENTYFLKNIQQAQKIRKNIMDSFETAAIPGQPDSEQRRLLHFVVVGGGPTGVEFAAELRDFVKDDLQRYYPSELVEKAQITLVDGLDKILNTFSEEISHYTQRKFQREGTNVVTNTFVTEVGDKIMHLMDSRTKEKRQMSYGMCIWCAGVAPRDITKQLMKDIPGQTSRMGLLTDYHFKVKNTRNIFAVGDCSTIKDDQFTQSVNEVFGSYFQQEGIKLSKDQIEVIVEHGMEKYPKFCHHFKVFKEQLNVDDSSEVSVSHVKNAAQRANAKETALPPTAQVAAQEGKYLGKLFTNHLANIEEDNYDDVLPFKYRYLGSFAYIGDNSAVLKLPVVGSFMGWSIMWLWRGAYASECVSFRMRALVIFDWLKSYLFGRDTSRI